MGPEGCVPAAENHDRCREIGAGPRSVRLHGRCSSYLPLVRSFDRARSEVREDKVRERSSTLRLRPAPTAEYRSILHLSGFSLSDQSVWIAFCVAISNLVF